MREISEPTRRLSEYIADARHQSLSSSVIEKATQHILDTLAAMISGTQLRPGRLAINYVRALGGTPQSSVVGATFLTSTVHAALCNGMLAHADETDDSHAPSRTHPGCAVIPAALAVAESAHASGDVFIKAVVLGYDVCARVSYALGAEAFAAAARSTHSVAGTFGAGAAAAAVLDLNAKQSRAVLSFCAQQASGAGCNVRDPEHVEKAFDFGGMPARDGVAAATMVASGMTGVDDVFSGERNFLEAYAAQPDPSHLSDELGRRFEVCDTNIKKWPVGSPAQSALDAVTALVESDSLRAGDIEHMEVHLPSRASRTVDNAPMPDINVQHLISMLLIDEALTFASIHDSARLHDPSILALKQKIAVVPSEELTRALPPRQAIVNVVTRDGRKLSQRCAMVRGTAANPMTRGEVEAKATELMTGVLGPGRANEIVRAIADFTQVRDVTALRPLWML